MKHGIQLPVFPIKVVSKECPTPADTANESVSIIMCAKQSFRGFLLVGSKRRATEESATIIKTPCLLTTKNPSTQLSHYQRFLTPS